MSKSKTSSAAATQSSERYDVFAVRPFTGRGGKDANEWVKIGVAFPHKEKPGYNIQLVASPIDGKLVMLPHEAKEDHAE